MKALPRTLYRAKNGLRSVQFLPPTPAATRPTSHPAAAAPSPPFLRRGINTSSSQLGFAPPELGFTPPEQQDAAYTEENLTQELAYDLGASCRAKWGWVIYRCTYGDDDAWERFKTLVLRSLREELAEADVPPAVRNAADWHFVEDPARLDGASRNVLRERFVAWVAEASVTERLPGPVRFPIRNNGDYTRYRFFVQVDEECLRSVVEQPEDPGWVYLVRCEEGLDYNQSPETLRDVEEYKKQLVDGEDYDAEDCILLSASSLGMVCYVDLSYDLVPWYCAYSQPPNLVVWR